MLPTSRPPSATAAAVEQAAPSSGSAASNSAAGNQESTALRTPDEHPIANGDLVIVYESPTCMKAVRVSSLGRFDNRFGAFAHKDWIGKRFGSKVYATKGGKGWCYLLKPTPELWTLVLKHRTQILYLADISMVCFQLELRPGLVVLESGTGSASLTHSLGRAVAPTGHVWTYEFHPERAQEAQKELTANGMGSVATVTQRDIMENGFPLERHEGRTDAVFLDLPGPWKVVANAAKCLKPNGRFCSFSPCIEQVQRTCEALRENGFVDIQTLEVLLRELEVRSERLQLCVDEAEPSAASGLEAAGKPAASAATPDKEGPEASTPEAHQEDGTLGSAVETEGAAGKDGGPAPKRHKGGQQPWDAVRHMVCSKPQVDARGHTGYLTFARKFV